MLNFRDNLFTDSFSFKETKALRSPIAESDVSSSKQVSGVEVRLSKVFIRDNKTKRFGPFPGLAKVYFLNIVATDIAASQVEINLNGFEKVDDNHTLAVDRTLFFWKKTAETPKGPSQIHIMSSLIKSKKGLRDAAKVIAEAKENPKFKTLVGDMGKLMKSATAVGNISDLVLSLAGIVGDLLGKVEDKPLLTRFQSFTDLAGNFDQLGKTDLPFTNKYAEVDYSIFIRDKERMEEAEG
jgi:hypothetical protein